MLNSNPWRNTGVWRKTPQEARAEIERMRATNSVLYDGYELAIKAERGGYAVVKRRKS